MMHAFMVAVSLVGFAPPRDTLPRVAVSGIRWETYRRLWTTWMEHKGLPTGKLSPLISTPPERPPSIDPSLDYHTIPETLRPIVAQFHDFFRSFLAEADLLFIGEKVDFDPGIAPSPPLGGSGCPVVRYTYRIREILFTTGRIPASVGDTLDFYGTDSWTGYYETHIDSLDRVARSHTRNGVPLPPPSAYSPVSVYWPDPYYPRSGDEAMFLSPHPASPALIAVRLWGTLRDQCKRKGNLVLRPPWSLDRFPGFWSSMPLLLAFRVEKGDTTFFFPLWRGWVWDRLTMRDVRWIARRFQEAYLREKGGKP